MNFQGHPARQRNRKASTATVLLLSAVIAACGTTDSGRLGGSAEARGARLAQAGEYQEAASVYIGLAAATSGSERDRLTLLAVDNWLDAGDKVRAQNAFRGVLQPADGDLLLHWNATRAAMLLYDGEAEPARDLLESLSRQSLPPNMRLRVEALRADAWFQLQDPTRAIELLMQRETWLEDRLSIERNRDRLWQGLLVSDPLVLRGSAETATDPTLRGWLTLGALATATGQQGIGWSNGVIRWRERNAGHPAMSVLEDLDIPADQLLDYPRRIALLLPLSGRTGSATDSCQGNPGQDLAGVGRIVFAGRHRLRDLRRQHRRLRQPPPGGVYDRWHDDEDVRPWIGQRLLPCRSTQRDHRGVVRQDEQRRRASAPTGCSRWWRP